MSDQPQNPPAFPHSPAEDRHGNALSFGETGMSLRDYFAGKALICSLSHEKNMVCLGGHQLDQIKNIAEDCYLMAEAMLKARGK